MEMVALMNENLDRGPAIDEHVDADGPAASHGPATSRSPTSLAPLPSTRELTTRVSELEARQDELEQLVGELASRLDALTPCPHTTTGNPRCPGCRTASPTATRSSRR